MSYSLKGRLFVSILFNEKEFPLGDINVLDYLLISSSSRIYLPTLSFLVNDTSNFLTKNNLLLDGTLITVTVGIDMNRKVMRFRLFSFKEFPGTLPKYRIVAYYDAPKYWTSSITAPLRGSSSSVLQTLAIACGLTFNGERTTDSMSWVPQNVKIMEYARRIAQHGWLSERSCMQAAVTMRGELRYKDVSDFNRLTFTDSFDTTKVSESIKPMTDYKILSKSGFLNAGSGYQYSRVSQSVVANEDTTLTKYTYTKNTQKLMMNSGIKSNVLQNKVMFSPVDTGNVHPNYERALYQNTRGAGTFNLGFELLTPFISDGDLYDVINVAIETPEVRGSKQYGGRYLMTSKCIYVKGANYFEKLELSRQGIDDGTETTQQ